MKRWNHLHTLLAGAAGWSLVDGRWWTYLLAVALGAAAGAGSVLVVRQGRRLIRRVDRALPDAARIPWETPMSADGDYLAGAERGVRQARRAAGYEDGKLAESTRLLERPAP